MRVVTVKPAVNPLVSGEVIFTDTNEPAVRALVAVFTEMCVQPDLKERLLREAARDKVLLARVASLAEYEVEITVDEVEDHGGTVTVRYTAYPGRRLPPLT